jgi:hypothetical protein
MALVLMFVTATLSTKPLQEVVTLSEGRSSMWIQTGYKINVTGTLLYILTLLTLLGFQVLLLIISLSYYLGQGVNIKVWAPMVEDKK